MKTSLRFHFALLTACVALPAGGLFAQAPAATATPSVSAPAQTATAPAEAGEDNEGKMRMRAMSRLTPEERQKLRTARQAAMQDPAVKAAEATRATDKRGYHQTMVAAMIKADPSVAPILEKMREERPNRKNLGAQ